jgi:diguanylate cyclase
LTAPGGWAGGGDAGSVANGTDGTGGTGGTGGTDGTDGAGTDGAGTPAGAPQPPAVEDQAVAAPTLDDATPAPTAPLTPQAVATALEQACAEAQRVLQHRHHLVEQLGRLVNELTDGLGDLAEDDSWVRGQCEAMRGQLDDGLTVRGVRSVSDLLRTTRLRQQQLRGERAQARDALKQLIHRMLQDIGELGEHTGRFHESVGRYAEAIGSADSLESLAGTVREMVEETRAVHDLVSQAQQRLQAEHARASELSQRVQVLEDEIRRLSDEVGTDQLTQVANRRGLMVQFEAERSRVERAGTTMAVALLDIDNFKKLNDTLGHATGDEALKFLSRRVKELLRPTDVLARFGGEEFVVLLPATGVEEAQTLLTRVQRQLSAECFMHENRQSFITFSAGATPYRSGEPLEQALQRADEALYEAKRTGKNRTCVA